MGLGDSRGQRDGVLLLGAQGRALSPFGKVEAGTNVSSGRTVDSPSGLT